MHCKTCEGTDRWSFFECPRKTADHRSSLVCHYVGGAFNGALPAPGGMLQQCASFVAALRFVNSQMVELQAPDHG